MAEVAPDAVLTEARRTCASYAPLVESRPIAPVALVGPDSQGGKAVLEPIPARSAESSGNASRQIFASPKQ